MKKNNIVVILTLVLFLLTGSSSFAQEEVIAKESPISVSCDLMSRYIWRGKDFGASPSIQPGISYSIAGLEVGAWGAFTTNLPGVQEADLFVSYTIKDLFSITVTDYFFPDELNANYNYFDYKDLSTGHVFEGALSFNGTEKLPLSVLIASNFYGADARKKNADGTSGKIQFSTYAEIAYAFNYFNVFMGFNIMDPDESKGESGYYGDSFGVVNLGITASKDIKITEKFALPLTVSLITNPQAEKIYMVAGFTF